MPDAWPHFRRLYGAAGFDATRGQVEHQLAGSLAGVEGPGDLRGRGVGTWLFRHGAAWLRLGGTDRLLVHLVDDDALADRRRYYARFGLHPINRTVRGWRRAR